MAKVGRKTKRRDQRQTSTVMVRVTDHELSAFKEEAEELGLSMSAWARMKLRAAVFSDSDVYKSKNV